MHYPRPERLKQKKKEKEKIKKKSGVFGNIKI